MRTSSTTHLAWALVAILAFSAGYLKEREPKVSSGGLQPQNGGARGSGSERSGSHLGAESNGAAVRPGDTDAAAKILSPDAARAMTFELLKEPNCIERLAQLCELLRQVTPENWRAVMDAFTRQTAAEGREHGGEWKLMLQRVGAVAGAEAVLDALNSNGGNRDDRARNTLEGWVAEDAKAAMAWVEQQAPEHRQVLLPAVIVSLASTSPVQALEIAMTQVNAATRDWAIPEIVNAAVQEGGFRKGEDLLGAVMHRPDVDEAMKRRLFGELTRKQITMARVRKRPMDSLQWLDGYLVGEGSPAAPDAVGRIVASAGTSDPNAALQWVDARAERLNPGQATLAYTAALQAVYKESPEQFTGWLNANPSNPARNSLVEAYTNDLIAFGRIAEAQEWVKSVQDPATRQRIEGNLRKAEAKSAAK
jgi:hypothetical protein